MPGDLEHGFMVARFRRCGDRLRVPFTCKSRGICPSCMGRRLAKTAALARRPPSAGRAVAAEWVRSFEGPIAVRRGYGPKLLGRAVREAGGADAWEADEARAWVAQQQQPARVSSSWSSPSVVTWTCSCIRTRWSPMAALRRRPWRTMRPRSGPARTSASGTGLPMLQRRRPP